MPDTDFLQSINHLAEIQKDDPIASKFDAEKYPAKDYFVNHYGKLPEEKLINTLESYIDSKKDNTNNILKQKKEIQSDYINNLSEYLKKGNEKSAINLFRLIEREREDNDFFARIFFNQKVSSGNNLDSRALLKSAIEDQNFILAKSLIESGVELDQDSKDAFTFAMQTNSAVVQRHYESIGGHDRFRASGFGRGEFHHHIVKRYGLSLGIAYIAADGTSSERGFTGPSLNEITKRLGLYARSDRGFQEIYRANQASLTACDYYGSMTRRASAGANISAMIQGACIGGGTVCLPCGYSQHMIGVYIVDGYLVVSDRQNRPGYTPGTYIYKIKDPSAYTPEVVDKIINGVGRATPKAEVLEALYSGVNRDEPAHVIAQKGQKVSNCTIANTKSVIAGVLLVQELRTRGGIEAGIQDEVKLRSHTRYKSFTQDFRRTTVNELIDELRRSPTNRDLVGMAVTYINSRYTDKKSSLMLSLYNGLSVEARAEIRPEVRASLEVRDTHKDILDLLIARPIPYTHLSSQIQEPLSVLQESLPELSDGDAIKEDLPASSEKEKQVHQDYKSISSLLEPLSQDEDLEIRISDLSAPSIAQSIEVRESDLSAASSIAQSIEVREPDLSAAPRVQSFEEIDNSNLLMNSITGSRELVNKILSVRDERKEAPVARPRVSLDAKMKNLIDIFSKDDIHDSTISAIPLRKSYTSMLPITLRSPEVPLRELTKICGVDDSAVAPEEDEIARNFHKISRLIKV